jgi:activating signal cointegrator complex subunit 2
MSTSIPLAPYPPPPIRASISQSEWSTILDAWNTAVTHLLQLPTVKFTAALANRRNNITRFLHSYLTSSPPPSAAEPDSRAFKTLHKSTFLLLHRTLTIPKPPPQLLSSPDPLLGFARLYSRVPAAQKLLDGIWETHEPQLEAAVTTLKRSYVSHAAPLAKLFSLSPKAAAMFLAGDEFTDSVVEAGDEISAKVFAKALIEAPRTNWSVVIDSIYSLSSSTGAKEKAFLLVLARLGVGEKLLALAKGTEYEARVSTVVGKLQTFGTASRKPREGRKRVVDKGKSPAYAGGGEEAEMAEMASKVDLIRDLFPSLGIGFVRQCLQSMGGDVEAVTSALLEDKLPADLEGVSGDGGSYVSPANPPPLPPI